MDTKSHLHLVISTVDKKRVANSMAKFLISQKFAACVNIVENVESHYLWKGKFSVAKEYMLLIKTDNPQKLFKALKKIHPYKVPEGISIKINRAYKAYEKWAIKTLQK